ncbi:MAG: glycosyltransferase family 4 protein, partial [Actinomycetota bacterium]
VYVRKLGEALLATADGNEYKLLVAQQLRDFAAGSKTHSVIAAGLPLKLLYSGWNWLNVPAVKVDLDVVHATGLVIPSAGDAKLVATIHDLAVKEIPHVVPAFWRALYSRGFDVALKKARIVCTVSAAVRERLIQGYGIEPARVIVTPEAPGILPSHPRKAGTAGRLGLEGPYILTVGTLEPRKNQAMLIRAFAAARDKLPDFKLVVAGAAGWGSTDVLEAIESERVADRVVVTGRLEDAELAALYGSAELFAFPSLYEGFGLPLAEALAFGLPCVASDDPALREVAGAAAIFVSPADPQAWSQALVEAAGDEALRKRLRTEGPRRVEPLSWQKTAEATRQAYRLAVQS